MLRWRQAERGLISPMTFIPIAEDCGLIVPIGEWVLEGACRQAKAWLDAGLPKLIVAVNVSARQFVAGDLPHLVKRTLAATGLPPDSLELEITESVAMNDVEGTVRVLREIADASPVTLSEKGRHARDAMVAMGGKAAACGRLCDVLEKGL